MRSIHESIEIEADLHDVYNQWTQFEEFPKFMEGVKEVHQLGDRRVSWRVEIMGRSVEWNAEIVEQVPDERITWRSVSGPMHQGSVAFSSSEEGRTHVSVHIDYEPESAAERAGSAVGLVQSRVKGDLKRFKEFIERRKSATGAWRGEIQEGQVTEPPFPGAMGAEA